MDNITGTTETKETKLPNLRHMAFIREYLKCKNATEAYLMVYPGVSRKTAQVNGSKLLLNTIIKARIDEIKAEIKAKYKIEQEDLIAKLLHIADNTTTASPAISIAAIKEIGRLAGLYIEKRDITSGGERISINLNLKDE